LTQFGLRRLKIKMTLVFFKFNSFFDDYKNAFGILLKTPSAIEDKDDFGVFKLKILL